MSGKNGRSTGAKSSASALLSNSTSHAASPLETLKARVAIQFWHHHSSSQEANTLFSNKFLELKGLRLEWRRTRPRLLIPPHSTTSYPSSSLASAGVLRRPSSVARQFPTRLLPIHLSPILRCPGSHGSWQRRFGRSSVLFGNRAMPSHWWPICREVSGSFCW